MNIAFIFPGQGSQGIGIGKELYDNFDVAKQVLDKVDDALSEKLSKIIFEGPEEELTKTYNTQPALMAISMAVIKVIEKLSSKKSSEIASIMAGHSLGQYTALCASGAIEIGECAKILRARGKFMQESSNEGEGAMAAVIGASGEIVKTVLEDANKLGSCQIANDNSNDQIVISGHANAIEFALDKFKELGIKAVKLKVSAPFHSKLMLPAAEKMREIILNANIKIPKVKIIDNVSLEITNDVNFIKEKLIKQIPGTVRWRETMDIIATKTDSALEIGAGKVLSGLFRKSYPEFNCSSVITIKDIEEFVNSIS